MGTRGKVRSLDYLAGLFDGEGSVSIIRHTRKDATIGFQHQLRVVIGMIDREAVNAYLDRWGGVFYESKEHLKFSRKWRPAFAWTLNGRQATPFLKQMFPRLYIKRSQAEVGLRFQSLLMPFGRGGVPAKNMAERERLWKTMRTLNNTLDRFGGTARRD